jgi:hypothetical protein
MKLHCDGRLNFGQMSRYFCQTQKMIYREHYLLCPTQQNSLEWKESPLKTKVVAFK